MLTTSTWLNEVGHLSLRTLAALPVYAISNASSSESQPYDCRHDEEVHCDNAIRLVANCITSWIRRRKRNEADSVLMNFDWYAGLTSGCAHLRRDFAVGIDGRVKPVHHGRHLRR